jgi:hypothetical protein
MKGVVKIGSRESRVRFESDLSKSASWDTMMECADRCLLGVTAIPIAPRRVPSCSPAQQTIRDSKTPGVHDVHGITRNLPQGAQRRHGDLIVRVEKER